MWNKRLISFSYIYNEVLPQISLQLIGDRGCLLHRLQRLVPVAMEIPVACKQKSPAVSECGVRVYLNSYGKPVPRIFTLSLGPPDERGWWRLQKWTSLTSGFHTKAFQNKAPCCFGLKALFLIWILGLTFVGAPQRESSYQQVDGIQSVVFSKILSSLANSFYLLIMCNSRWNEGNNCVTI